MTAVEKLIAKYNKQWNKYGMGSVISYSKVVSDLIKILEKENEQIGYSEEDVRKAILFGQGMELWKEEFQINGFIQSLQQKHELNKSE